MLAARAAAEILARDQDARILVGRLVEHEVRVRRAGLVEEAVLGEQALPEARALDRLQILLGDDHVRVYIDHRQRCGDARDRRELFHRPHILRAGSRSSSPCFGRMDAHFKPQAATARPLCDPRGPWGPQACAKRSPRSQNGRAGSRRAAFGTSPMSTSREAGRRASLRRSSYTDNQSATRRQRSTNWHEASFCLPLAGYSLHRGEINLFQKMILVFISYAHLLGNPDSQALVTL